MIATAAVAIAYLVFRNGGWVYDDNLYLVLAHTQGFSFHWLTWPLFQHLAIAPHAIYSLEVTLFPLDFRWALVVMLCLFGAAIYVFERVLAMLFGRSPISVWLTAWFGLSILWARGFQWWAFGVQAFPTVFFDLLCLYGYLRYVADGRKRWVAVSGGALTAGLLFYEKPAFMLVYLALMRTLFMSPTVRPRPLAAIFWRERAIWLTFIAIVGAWGAGYLAAGAGSGVSLGHLGLVGYLSFFRIMWVNTLVPAILGVTIPVSKLDAGQAIFVALAQIAVLGCVLLSVRRKRSAWRAWTFLAIVVLLNGVLVAHDRAALFGPAIGGDPRYLIDFAWLTPIAGYFALSRRRTLTPTVVDSPVRLRLRDVRAPVRLGAVVLFAAYATASAASIAHMQKTWNSVQARHWEENLQRGFATLAREQVYPVVADNELPFEIISYPFAPYNRLSDLLPIYVGSVQVDGPLIGQLVTVDAAGNVARAGIGAAVGEGSMPGLLRKHQAQIAGAPIARHRGKVCIVTGAAYAQVSRTLFSAPPAGSGPYYAAVRYSVSQPLGLELFEDTGKGYPDATPDRIVVAPYGRISLAWLSAGWPHRLKLIVPPHATLCLSRMDVVTLRAGS